MINSTNKIRYEIVIPEAMAPYMKKTENEAMSFAIILYPFIQNGDLSYGQAANILGVKKIDLIDYYGEKELPYFTETPEQLEDDINKLINDKRLCI